MRKLTMEIELNEDVRDVFKPIFSLINSYEVLENLKIDRMEGICVDLIEFELLEDISISDLKTVGHIEILYILKSEGNRHICLVKQDPKGYKGLFKEFDLDLIMTTPCIISDRKHVYSVIGSQDNISKFIEQMKDYGKIQNISIKNAAYDKYDILSVLTKKQKEILIAAQKYGYYDYPKKITSQSLSKKVNISRATLVQHLRKAEGRILAEIIAGHDS